MKRFLHRNRRIFLALLEYELILIAIAVVIGLLRGRLTLNSFGSTLALLGGLLISFSLLSVFGTWGSTRSFEYQYGMSVGHTAKEREAHARDEIREAKGFLTNSIIVGWFTGVLGLLLIIL